MAMQPEPLPIDFADAIARVDLRRLGEPTLFFSTIGSTNDVATALANNGNHEGAVVIAETQTAGRGRRGRVWFSPPGAGLYVSVLLAPARAVRSADRATAYFASANPITFGTSGTKYFATDTPSTIYVDYSGKLQRAQIDD